MWYFVKIYKSMHWNDNPSLNPQTAESIYWEVPSIRNLPFFLLKYYVLLNYWYCIIKTINIQFCSNTNHKSIFNIKIWLYYGLLYYYQGFIKTFNVASHSILSHFYLHISFYNVIVYLFEFLRVNQQRFKNVIAAKWGSTFWH